MEQVQTADREAGQDVTNCFVIDGRSSRFTVRAFATGLLSAMGHNPTISIRDFSGEIRFNPDKLEAGAFRLAVRAASLGIQDDISSNDRREMERVMNEEVLETAKFPEIVYEASRIAVTRLGDPLYAASLDGALSLHGVVHNEPITARVTCMGAMLRASGDLSLSQSAYNIKPVSVAGGALKVKDELKLSFEIVARKPT
jgi:polyisoprenoid-binding protein YceI